jgi:nucleoside 2-deoxyribosyltransferase
MQVIYAGEKPPETFTKSIFLAGPTPRSQDVESWRPEALRLLEENGFDGVVFVPEDESGEYQHSYVGQVQWEHKCLNMSDVILFWIPRDMEKLPGMTTNVEFGHYITSGKVILGYPENTPKTKYLEWMFFKHHGKEIYDELPDLIRYAMHRCGEGAERTGGERCVPLRIWNQRHFQDWIAQVKRNGNRLDRASVRWVGYVNKGSYPFAWAMHVSIWVGEEKRHKDNEFIFTRPDLASIVLYQQPESEWDDHKIVIIKEFRSTCRNESGFVFDLASGSSFREGMANIAAAEIMEETGLNIPPERIEKIGSRQPLATFSTHHAHLFRVELFPEEMKFVEDHVANNTMFGNTHESEQTYLEVYKLQNLISDPVDVDWATLGMIFAALSTP